MIVLGEGPPQELDGTTVRADATNILLIFQDHKENLVLDFVIMEGTVFFFVSDTKNISIQCKKLCRRTICIVFRKYFERFYSQWYEEK